jgi:hypothetical protein
MVLATDAAATFNLQLEASAIQLLRNFQFVPFYPHRDGPLYACDAHQKMFPVIVIENSYQTVQSAAANAHPLSAVQERTDRARRLHFQKTLQSLDFMVRNWGGLVAGSGKSQDAAGFQDGKTLLTNATQANEYVSREKRRLYSLTAVTPAVHGIEQRQKGLSPALAEHRFHSFFEA